MELKCELEQSELTRNWILNLQLIQLYFLNSNGQLTIAGVNDLHTRPDQPHMLATIPVLIWAWIRDYRLVPTLAPATTANLELTCVWSKLGLVQVRAHKNGGGWLEEERVTPIEAHNPVKIIKPY